jgi:hypothetical protein
LDLIFIALILIQLLKIKFKDGNPLKMINNSILKKGTVSILEYLKTKHQG